MRAGPPSIFNRFSVEAELVESVATWVLNRSLYASSTVDEGLGYMGCEELERQQLPELFMIKFVTTMNVAAFFPMLDMKLLKTV
ncbi:hypothetical protein ACFX1Q_010257 [Malus domestica]